MNNQINKLIHLYYQFKECYKKNINERFNYEKYMKHFIILNQNKNLIKNLII